MIDHWLFFLFKFYFEVFMHRIFTDNLYLVKHYHTLHIQMLYKNYLFKDRTMERNEEIEIETDGCSICLFFPLNSLDSQNQGRSKSDLLDLPLKSWVQAFGSSSAALPDSQHCDMRWHCYPLYHNTGPKQKVLHGGKSIDTQQEILRSNWKVL